MPIRFTTLRAFPPYRPFFFFFNDTATTEIYTLSLHDALPISSTGDQDRNALNSPLTIAGTSCSEPVVSAPVPSASTSRLSAPGANASTSTRPSSSQSTRGGAGGGGSGWRSGRAGGPPGLGGAPCGWAGYQSCRCP